MQFTAAVFDLDGTLIESNTVWEKIDRQILDKRNIKYSYDSLIKLTAMSFEDALLLMHELGVTDTDEVIMNEFFELAVYEYRNNIFIKENVKEYLTYLREDGIKTALCTASPKRLYEPVLRNNHIYSLFDAFTTTDEIGKSKDYPDVYLSASSKLGVLPSECVVFEDTLKGIVSAKNAGMKTVAVYDKYSSGDTITLRSLADRFIFSFSEMM